MRGRRTGRKGAGLVESGTLRGWMVHPGTRETVPSAGNSEGFVQRRRTADFADLQSFGSVTD